ncbi:hypothetical protein PROFUN_10981 [Planoprotostelium fungivorum]|uniref:Uncharacterized protein n=1 Tax=Planoprotostelium fungivorum TaxID=1890364 RepID=A0A2P6NBX2_9EUKA|nr:hypothetical protein PROFUN_10981 [Planoprotostelium fungivorum]
MEDLSFGLREAKQCIHAGAHYHRTYFTLFPLKCAGPKVLRSYDQGVHPLLSIFPLVHDNIGNANNFLNVLLHADSILLQNIHVINYHITSERRSPQILEILNNLPRWWSVSSQYLS